MDIGGAIGRVLSPAIGFLSSLLGAALALAALSAVLFLSVFLVRYRVNPFRPDPDRLRQPYIKYKYYDLLRWLLVDFWERGQYENEFKEYGFTFFVGRQGAGKTISMVHYLDLMKDRYPNCLIVTNFGYYQADYVMKDWRDLMSIRNGTNGVIFAIDEVHSEYSSTAWKDVPEDLLSEISQQRKQRVKIVATAQFYTRVAKPLREQAATVVICRTWAGRLTSNKVYDAIDYAIVTDNPNVVGKKLKPLSKTSFVQSDGLRACYDTYEKIQRMRKTKFIPRAERGA